MKKSFGDRLRDLRKDASQAEIACKIGVSGQSWGFYERNQKEPTLETVGSICRLFDVSADWLLGLSDKEPARPAAVTDAPSVGSDSYWRDLVASQQATIRDLAAALAASQRPSTQPATPALSGGRSAIKTA